MIEQPKGNRFSTIKCLLGLIVVAGSMTACASVEEYDRARAKLIECKSDICKELLAFQTEDKYDHLHGDGYGLNFYNKTLEAFGQYITKARDSNADKKISEGLHLINTLKLDGMYCTFTLRTSGRIDDNTTTCVLDDQGEVLIVQALYFFSGYQKISYRFLINFEVDFAREAPKFNIRSMCIFFQKSSLRCIQS